MGKLTSTHSSGVVHIGGKSCYYDGVKKVARFVLFTFIAFVLIFVCAVTLSYLQLWITAASAMPARATIPLDDVLARGRWALSLSLYLTMLLGLNYAQRNGVFAPLAFAAAIVICGGMTYAAALGMSNARAVRAAPFYAAQSTIGEAGLMLTQWGTTTILLDKPSLETGSRVIAAPDRPLVYLDVPLDEQGLIIELPPVRFREEGTTLYAGLQMDFAASAALLSSRFEEGFLPLIFWLAPLLALLAALSYLFNVGAWPLANLFLCAVVFRLVLLFEVFITSNSVSAVLIDFVRGFVPARLIGPLILAVLAALFLLYDILMHFARERGRYGA